MLIHAEKLTMDSLDALLRKTEGPHVSIYLPTHGAGSETRQDPIRFGNLIKSVRQELQNHFGLSKQESNELLGSLTEVELLGENAEFWRHQKQGLALFARKGLCSMLSLPEPCRELTVVGHCFHVVPLLPTLQDDERFFILVVTLKAAHLYRASHYSIHQVDGPGTTLTLPTLSLSPKDTSRLNVHSFRHGNRGGETTAMYHGHEDRDLEEHILQYLREVDKAVTGHIRDTSVPLVFAGTDSLSPLYQEVNSHRGLASEGVTGNPESFSDQELRERAWDVVAPQVRERRDRVIDRFHEAKSAGRTSVSPEEILQETNSGLVDTLLFEINRCCWTSRDGRAPEAASVVHDRRQAGDDDLINVAVTETMRTGGDVVGLPGDAMPPGSSPIAAILRHAAISASEQTSAAAAQNFAD